MTTAKRFPQQEDCDLSDPEEHFLWALTQVPFGQFNSQPIQPSLARTISKHLWECGFRHLPRLQNKKLQMPHRGQQHYLNASAKWVGMDEPNPDPVVMPDVKSMTVHEQELLLQEFDRLGKTRPEPREETETAQVVRYSDVKSTRIHKASELLGENDGRDTEPEPA
jgi:hypothetical protein